MPGELYKLLRPLLFTLPPEAAHNAAISALRMMHPTPVPPPRHPVSAMGLEFPNPLGLAAGLDKNADASDALASLGFGFIESGAITPEPQSGNPPPRIFRLPEAHAIINRMGFNNCGMQQADRNLSMRSRNYVLGINLGKNSHTPAEEAARDYMQGLQTLYARGDFFTVNVSSPNTPGLRNLQSPDVLKQLLRSVIECRDQLAKQHNRCAPLAVKFSPDLSDEELKESAKVAVSAGADGIIACNTTTTRPPEVASSPYAKETGGLSGKPLANRSLQMTKLLRELLPPQVALISTGGICSAEDAQTRLCAGATLVQIYTALIYQGPTLPRQILRGLHMAN